MKILFVSYDLGIGGIQKSLINLLKKMVKENPESQIDLLLFNAKGEYFDQLPKEINVLTASKGLELSVKSYGQVKKDGSLSDRVKKICAYARIKLLGYSRYYSKLVGKKITHIGYDLAISYSHDNYCSKFLKGANLYVLRRVEAKEKHAYLHADISKEPVDLVHMESIYSQFDKVFAVSKACRDILIEKIPSLKDIADYRYNVFDEEELRTLADAYVPFEKQEGITYFSTVTRLSYAKGIDRIFKIVEELVASNVKIFKWYVVGEGQGEYTSSKLNSLTKKKELDSYLEFVGNKENPFPYVANSDLFVFPSRFESFAMVVKEASILNVPIVTCDYSAAQEILEGTGNTIVSNKCEDLYVYLSSYFKNTND